MTQDISTLDFVAFDTETTGLQASSGGLVELAAVRFRLLEGTLETFQTLVNPGMPIPWQATQVHGITDEMVFEAPKVEQLLPSFYQFLEGSVPLAHNAPFDLGFLSLFSLRAGIKAPALPVLDSCQLSRHVQPEVRTHRLQALVEGFSIPASAFHRALADARSCMEVFRALIFKSCGVNASWEELLKLHGRTFTFQDSSRPLTEAASSPHFEPLYQALQAKRPVWILYEGSYSARELTPHLLYARGQQQYLEATCHLDGIRKSFRLDRIKEVLGAGNGREREK